MVVLSEWESDKSSTLNYLCQSFSDISGETKPKDESSYPLRHTLRQHQRRFSIDSNTRVPWWSR